MIETNQLHKDSRVLAKLKFDDLPNENEWLIIQDIDDKNEPMLSWPYEI